MKNAYSTVRQLEKFVSFIYLPGSVSGLFQFDCLTNEIHSRLWSKRTYEQSTQQIIARKVESRLKVSFALGTSHGSWSSLYIFQNLSIISIFSLPYPFSYFFFSHFSFNTNFDNLNTLLFLLRKQKLTYYAMIKKKVEWNKCKLFFFFGRKRYTSEASSQA